MNIKKISAVYKKEIIDTLRDRRTLFMMILVPILIYPILYSFLSQIQARGITQLKEEKSKISLKFESHSILASMIKNEDKLEIVPSENPANDLKTGKIHGYINIEKKQEKDLIVIYYDGVVDRSRIAEERLSEVVAKYKRHLQEDNIRQAGMEITILEPFDVNQINIAPPVRMGGRILGVIIPMLLIVTLINGAMYPAIDLTAGEKERGTLETILTISIGRTDLFLGKFFTVVTVAIITGVLNLVSIIMTFIFICKCCIIFDITICSFF